MHVDKCLWTEAHVLYKTYMYGVILTIVKAGHHPAVIAQVVEH